MMKRLIKSFLICILAFMFAILSTGCERAGNESTELSVREEESMKAVEKGKFGEARQYASKMLEIAPADPRSTFWSGLLSAVECAREFREVLEGNEIQPSAVLERIAEDIEPAAQFLTDTAGNSNYSFQFTPGMLASIAGRLGFEAPELQREFILGGAEHRVLSALVQTLRAAVNLFLVYEPEALLKVFRSREPFITLLQTPILRREDYSMRLERAGASLMYATKTIAPALDEILQGKSAASQYLLSNEDIKTGLEEIKVFARELEKALGGEYNLFMSDGTTLTINIPAGMKNIPVDMREYFMDMRTGKPLEFCEMTFGGLFPDGLPADLFDRQSENEGTVTLLQH